MWIDAIVPEYHESLESVPLVLANVALTIFPDDMRPDIRMVFAFNDHVMWVLDRLGNWAASGPAVVDVGLAGHPLRTTLAGRKPVRDNACRACGAGTGVSVSKDRIAVALAAIARGNPNMHDIARPASSARFPESGLAIGSS